jgi:hypothetical protein
MRLHLSPLLALAALTACDAGSVFNQPTWDPMAPVAAADGLYVRAVRGTGLIHVRPDGFVRVPVGDGEVRSVHLAPDGETAVALIRRTRCDPRDPRQAAGFRYVYECDITDRRVRGELAVIRGGEVERAARIGGQYNSVSFSPDGRWAMAWLDPAGPSDLRGVGVVDLTSVQMLDVTNGATTTVSVGFAASSVLFSDDGARAVVLSQDSVAVVDLTGEQPRRSTVFPLTLQAGQTFTPVALGLTPDGEHVLVAAQGRDDLYALRLDPPSINLINLSGTPAAMAILPPTNPGGDRETDPLARDDRTVLVHRNVARADIVDHDGFDVESVDLAGVVDSITTLDRTTLLWRQSAGRDAYHLNLEARSATRFHLQGSAFDLRVAPGGQRAVALTLPGDASFGESAYGLEILDLSDARGRTVPFRLEGPAVGLAFARGDLRLDALLLQRHVDYLVELDLLTSQQRELRLAAPPASIGAMPGDGGGFWITHQAALGLVSFYDPATGRLDEVSGFAASGLLEYVPLDRSDDEET